ncbi:F-box/kelch-repeat protein At3g27150-like [Gastrolobium bilobum]|uniref:F-box/kelch-repeat protein At3g27150-like n=1 Tax=Gastrolobium bilobum TaxID=150636 RepID=UPI002AB2B695|nr:F-box/kelch-repeat protein At3g27150-like [Gastrolobium bilobum]
MLESEQGNWCALDRHFKSCRKLPFIPSVYSFRGGKNGSFFAGTHQGSEVNFETNTYSEVSSCAEKYSSESQSWKTLPRMVIGGLDEQKNDLTCGEFFDEETNSWTLVPDMLKDIPLSTFRSPPLLSVVNNKLYVLDASSNEVKKAWLGPIRSSSLPKDLNALPKSPLQGPS